MAQQNVTTPKRNTPPLKAGHDQIWAEDFQDLQQLSKTAFLLRLLFRIHREIDTDTVSISDLEIRKKTGFGRNTIARAKKELIDNGDLTPISYTRYAVKPFKRFATDCSKMEQQDKNNLLQNGATTCSKMEHNLLQNGAQPAPKRSNTYRQITDTDKTDASFVSQKAKIQQEEIPWLRQQYPFQKRESLKNHLMARNYSELEAVQFLESFYIEYTGRKEVVKV